MNKKVSLKEIVGTKIVYAIILTSYYWMWARTDWEDWYLTAQYALGGVLIVGVMVGVAFGAAILGQANAVSTGFIGWTIVLSILVLSIIRTVIFVVMDSKGV